MDLINRIKIRDLKESEIHFLEVMLYEAVFQADEANPIPREVIHEPRVNAYIKDYGKLKDDHCLVAEFKGEIIGAVWVRILAGDVKGYGNVDDDTPEFAISLFKEYRNKGIGTLLMNKMITHLKERGFYQCSLSVEKRNYAVRLYKNLGFKIIGENKDDFIMVLKL